MITEDEMLRKQLEEVYYRYRNQVYYWASLKLPQYIDAEDTVQNVFEYLCGLVLRRKIVLYMDGRIYSLLKIMTEHICLNNIKKENNFLNCIRMLQTEYDETVDYKDDIEGIYKHMEYEEVVKYFSSMPAKYAEIMHMRYVLELPVKIIAQLMGLKEKTVQKRIERGKKMVDLYFETYYSDIKEN